MEEQSEYDRAKQEGAESERWWVRRRSGRKISGEVIMIATDFEMMSVFSFLF